MTSRSPSENRRRALDVGRVDHLAVALDVAAVAADHEQDELPSPAFQNRRGVVDSTYTAPPGSSSNVSPSTSNPAVPAWTK